MSGVVLVKRCLRCGAQNDYTDRCCRFCNSNLLVCERSTNGKEVLPPNSVRLEVLTPGWPRYHC